MHSSSMSQYTSVEEHIDVTSASITSVYCSTLQLPQGRPAAKHTPLRREIGV